jgi:glycosyltransferase involved in cell wall biosynthesis
MPKISSVIITKDSEKIIGKTVENALQFTDEVVVVNSKSTDNTAEVARKAGAHVIDYLEQFTYGGARQFGDRYSEENFEAEYTIHQDTDESIDPIQAPILNDLLSDPKFDVYLIRQDNYIGGNQIGSPRFVDRIFRKGKVHYQGLVGEALYPKVKASISSILIQNNTNGSEAKGLFNGRLVSQEWETMLINYNPDEITSITTAISRVAGLFSSVGKFLGEKDNQYLRNHIGKLYQKGLAIDWQDSALHLEMTSALYGLGDQNFANVLLELENSPDLSPYYLSQIASVRNGQGKYDLALKAIDRAIAAHPSAEYFKTKGNTLHMLKRDQEANRAMAKAYSINPLWVTYH